jgi:hypothetical protein
MKGAAMIRLPDYFLAAGATPLASTALAAPVRERPRGTVTAISGDLLTVHMHDADDAGRACRQHPLRGGGTRKEDLQSRCEPEAFVVDRWRPLRSGDVLDILDGITKHARRNRMADPVQLLVVTPFAAGAGTQSPRDIGRLFAISARYGYLNDSPQKNWRPVSRSLAWRDCRK